MEVFLCAGPVSFGATMEAATPWLQLALYVALRQGPPGLVLPAGQRLWCLPPGLAGGCCLPHAIPLAMPPLVTAHIFQNRGLRHAPFSLERFSPRIRQHYSMPSRQTCQRAVHYGSRCRQLTSYVLHCGYMTSCGRQAARFVMGTCVGSAARVQPYAGVALERKALCARSFGRSVFVASQIAQSLNKK